MALLLVSCGGEEPAPPGVPCVDEDPGEAATYANRHVAIGRELAPERSREGDFPWFAKTALFVRGNRQVVVRVPDELAAEVKIVGWGEPGAEPRAVALVEQSSCPGEWTAYPGGLVFRGRHCVRLAVEGPGDARDSLPVGLRREC